MARRWGDALYDKGEFDLAMAAYKETLHHLEPSYVLRRFLDAQVRAVLLMCMMVMMVVAMAMLHIK